MGKLNIAHHKSYHPYRRDNIERVRRDEEEARQKEEKEEERVMVADAEARIELLRKRAGLEDKGKQAELPLAQVEALSQPLQGSSSGKHINFFEDLEQNAIAAASIRSKKPPAETEKGIPLAPSKKDLNPWYSSNGNASRSKDGEEDWDDERRRKRERDTNRKSQHDPLTAIQHQLASSSSSKGKSTSKSKHRPSISGIDTPSKPSAQQARLTRESSERERALALIRAKKRQAMGSETPMSTRSDDASEYGDMYNRREVAAARESREKRRWGGSGGERGW
ncbi:hypothetical protein VNI00_000917 [Paramarasmius palmivorus]|uniref:CBF1-interacting co-repressor CIR N-terminal domain-containing protein n=1 Tax=Paramarasmius palmivorus TaxID=297713 RepID=A0AAW0E583_9AGAR